MEKWYMLTVVGTDRPGIVARLSHALHEGGCNLGEASMMRLGGNFGIMLMVRFSGSAAQLTALVEPVAESLGLRLHVDRIEARLHQHVEPDVRIMVTGSDRAGIVAHATAALAEAGLDILNLESDIAGTETHPIYIMYIEGRALEGVASLESAIGIIRREGIDAKLTAIETVIG
jgi:glycine cleavage system transcriptional repressor